ncbi:MAG: hypothetical protein IJI73_01505 [Kiritimatiellae bacterium]|nr:hypothetical protein [Kiritimatiellia bacterium]
MNRLAVLFAAFAAAAAADAAITAYPDYPKTIERDREYQVRVVQGKQKVPLVVWNHCEKSSLTRRTRGGDVNRRFCEFAFDGGGVRVDIAVRRDVKSYTVFPSRLKLRHQFKEGAISVWLDKPAMFGIRLNDYDKTILSVFAEAPEDPSKIPQKGAPGVMYVDGWQDPPGEDGVTVIDNGVKEVYIAPGAVLNSRLVVKSEGCYVHGRGMILDPLSNIFRFDQNKNTKRGFLNVSNHGVTLEDIKLVDSRTFNYCTWFKDVTFRNVKALSSMMCSDGITCGGRDLVVDGAWLYVGDNALVVSGIKGNAKLANIAIGTSCNAIFPQGSNHGVVLEDIDVFRADEGLIRNVYNGVLRRNNKWNEMNSGAARKEPGPQDLKHQTQEFLFRNLSAVDCPHFSRFFVGGNMGTLPKSFGFENVSVPFGSGSDDWKTMGKTDGVIVSIMHDPSKWLISDNYTLAFTNLWVGGSRMDAIPAERIRNGDRAAITVVNKSSRPELPAVANRVEVGWTCPEKRKVPLPEPMANLVEDVSPETAIRSIWQRCPSWMVKFDAVQRDEKGAPIYRLTQCEKGAGMLAVITERFLASGPGTYRFSCEARAKSENPFGLKINCLSNEQNFASFIDSVELDGDWKRYSVDVDLQFNMNDLDLMALSVSSTATADLIELRNISFSRQ